MLNVKITVFRVGVGLLAYGHFVMSSCVFSVNIATLNFTTKSVTSHIHYVVIREIFFYESKWAPRQAKTPKMLLWRMGMGTVLYYLPSQLQEHGSNRNVSFPTEIEIGFRATA